MHCNKETDMQQHKRCNSVQPTAPALYSGSNIHTPLTNHDEEGAFCGNSSQTPLSKQPLTGTVLDTGRHLEFHPSSLIVNEGANTQSNCTLDGGGDDRDQFGGGRDDIDVDTLR